MAITKCRECGGQVSTKAAACPNCGAPNPVGEATSNNAEISAPPKRKSATFKVVLIAIAVLWIIGTVAQMSAKRTSTQAAVQPVPNGSNPRIVKVVKDAGADSSPIVDRHDTSSLPSLR